MMASSRSNEPNTAPLSTGVSPAPVPRALILSESLVLRIGIRVLVNETGIARVAGESGSAHRLAEAVQALAAELVIVAPVDSPDESLLQTLDALPPSCTVLMLLSVPAFRIHSVTLRAEHDVACLPLDVSPKSLHAVIRSALGNERQALKVYELYGGPRGTLTPREQEVLRELALGLSNREIAARLLVSEDTVKAHLRRTYRKLGVSTRGGAIAMYVGNSAMRSQSSQ
jgi:DNA-binding NarL/FixJ family response regulator